MSRLPQGGQIDRSRDRDVLFDGRQLVAHPRDTLASALLANGIRLMGRSFNHRPRGILAAGSEKLNALVTIGRGAASPRRCARSPRSAPSPEPKAVAPAGTGSSLPAKPGEAR